MLYGLAPKLKFSIDQFRFKATPITGKHNVPLINFNKSDIVRYAKVLTGHLLLLLANLMALMLNGSVYQSAYQRSNPYFISTLFYVSKFIYDQKFSCIS
jgi:hypothetical protein